MIHLTIALLTYLVSVNCKLKASTGSLTVLYFGCAPAFLSNDTNKIY